LDYFIGSTPRAFLPFDQGTFGGFHVAKTSPAVSFAEDKRLAIFIEAFGGFRVAKTSPAVSLRPT
jgi:hypothetical protein